MLVAVTLSAAALATPARAVTYAPVDQPGPALDVPRAELAQALRCTGDLAGATVEPVLLIPGTTVTPQEFAWNYEPALDALRRPYCAVTLPGHAMADIQVSAEYVVYAIRAMHSRTGRPIALLGHSQGGMIGRWALRFWPDLRRDVDDVIGMAPSNHGTIDANGMCSMPGGCAAAIWQQRSDAAFIAALNSRQETFPGISYTVIYTHTDEVVYPNTSDSGSSSLHGGGGQIANVAIQSICPADVNEHLGIGTYDPVAYALALDALTHPGPADPARIARGVCAQQLMPGVNRVTFATDYGDTLAMVADTLATYPHASAEPSLRCYVTASCVTGHRSSHRRPSHRSARSSHRRRRSGSSSGSRGRARGRRAAGTG
jgi:pimeloyl-ACP methyl ester carboxylesterase